MTHQVVSYLTCSFGVALLHCCMDSVLEISSISNVEIWVTYQSSGFSIAMVKILSRLIQGVQGFEQGTFSPIHPNPCR